MNRNIVSSDAQRDFFVWVNPNDWFIQHHVQLVGMFSSIGSQDENLMLIPNPNFSGFIAPFQNNIVRNYFVEYNLELGRRAYFYEYPSRLASIFLFESQTEACNYFHAHLEHVGNRILKRVHTIGAYIYSTHDTCWVDFSRLPHSLDQETIEYIARNYWSGKRTCDYQLSSMGKAWSCDSIMEVLFIGNVAFYDKALSNSEADCIT